MDGLFLVTGGQSAALLVPAHYALNPVPPPVQPTTEPALPWLVRARGDHLLHPSSPQTPSQPWVAVTFVASQPTRPAATPFASRQDHPQQHGFQPLAVVDLPGREVHGQQGATTITDQMHLRPEAAPRTTQRMIFWLLKLRRLFPSKAGPHLGIFFSPLRLPGSRG